ncbi:hypothetical protein [Persicitalea sp.]|uniref:hypothetical protein n=1 Tax=Persicitalea sp. TaxID=3100273 RepID=UPI00359453A8
MNFKLLNPRELLPGLAGCILLGLGTATPAQAQEKFYWSNGSSFSNRIVEADERELKYEEKKGDTPHKRTEDRENVIVAFNAYGMYLIIDKLPNDPETSRMTLKKFYNTTGCPTDVLIRATPLEVIPATIRVEGEAINFLNEAGKSTSINKNDLVAIIYKNGSHQLLREPEEAKSFLNSAFDRVRRYCSSKPPHKDPPIPDDEKETITKIPEKPPGKPTLNEKEYQEYSKKALIVVEQFAEYLQVIASRNFSLNERDAAVKNALKLFLPDSKIKVSSKNRKGISEQTIESYLKRLKMLPYGEVQIKWSNIEYVDQFKQADDGNYYGRIIGSQTFTGFSETGESVKYSDVTRKDVKVKLQSYEKQVDGKDEVNWSVLLGNIGVVEND